MYSTEQISFENLHKISTRLLTVETLLNDEILIFNKSFKIFLVTASVCVQNESIQFGFGKYFD